jgi:hypothetical protein
MACTTCTSQILVGELRSINRAMGLFVRSSSYISIVLLPHLLCWKELIQNTHVTGG